MPPRKIKVHPSKVVEDVKDSSEMNSKKVTARGKKKQTIEAENSENLLKGGKTIAKRVNKKPLEEADVSEPVKVSKQKIVETKDEDTEIEMKSEKKRPERKTRMTKIDNENDETVPESSTKRGKKSAVKTSRGVAEKIVVGSPAKKPKKEATAEKSKLKQQINSNVADKNVGDGSEIKKKNQTVTDWSSIIFDNSKKNVNGDVYNLKITSWNVDGLRAWLKKGGMNIFEHDNPDVICLQETKCDDEKLPVEIKNIEGYSAFWCASEKDGYAGVAILSKIEPLSVKYGIDNESHDSEGRCITAEFDKFYLVCVYVPNAGRKLITLPKRLEWNDSFDTFVDKLNDHKPVIICGDLNVAHSEIDLANPKTNRKNAGFTKEERDGMTEFLDKGYVDTFRMLYPDRLNAYTFWTYITNSRSKNVGWRLDYFIVSQSIINNICDNVILSEVYGSDHCPISLFINI